MKISDLALVLVTFLLCLNALGVIYRIAFPFQNCHCHCSNTPTVNKIHYSTVRINKLETIEDFIPPGTSTLDPTHSQYSHTRIGSELTFDLASCPSQSVVPSKTKPLHTSCPAVFIIGARKAGTTSLYQYLSHHPDFEGIHLENGPKAGETFHFSARYSTESWELYKSRFPKQSIMTGDASVGNFVNCEAPKRIYESCGNFSKILLLLRNPIDRYKSNFLMRTKLGTKEYTNNTALSTVINMELSSFYKSLLVKGVHMTSQTGMDLAQWYKFCCMYSPSRNMIYEGLYYVHVMNWLCNYPAENILILNSEEFYVNTSFILRQVYQFLGLSPLSDDQRQLVTSFVFNKGASSILPHQRLQDEDHKKLKHIYSPFNKAILKLLNWNDIKW